MAGPPSWEALSALAPPLPAAVEREARESGLAAAQSNLRLFGHPADAAQVVLFVDAFRWCPYSAKVTLFLEEKRVPHVVRKVSMRCYGKKEAWYLKLVPNGMLPALQLTSSGPVITESDDILAALEGAHGPLHAPLAGTAVLPLRRLERQLFRAWCDWLCTPRRAGAASEEAAAAARFEQAAGAVAAALDATPGPWFLEAFSAADVVFTPYAERMRASLFYYKAYNLAAAHPALGRWFAALEARPSYYGLMGDFHTHAHDLPPQMGGCYAGGDAARVAACQRAVDRGPWAAVPEVSDPGAPPSPAARAEAARRVIKHRETLALVNPDKAPGRFDAALRCALAALLAPAGAPPPPPPPPGAELGLRHLRDQVSVPRDMTVHAARALRQALEDAAALCGDAQPPPLPTEHRFDQSAAPFVAAAAARGEAW
jgi:glutathione S-transferase